MQEKLLLLGIDSSTKYAIEYARSIGVTTVITDYNSVEKNSIKQMADEAWMIDVKDIDLLEKRCCSEKITGVYAGNHEYCLDKAQELAKRLELPFYASDEGWTCARDKENFKEQCSRVGIDTPKRFILSQSFRAEELERIHYPVIVKPSDSCAQQGLSLCYEEKELKDAYELALQFSETGNVIVEDYIDGDEICAHYYVDNGKIILTHINDDITMPVNDKQNFTLILNYSRYYQEYLDKVSKKVELLIQNLKCKNGVIFLQAIYKNGKFYFLEFAYRFDGIGQWITTKPSFGFSSVELMVNLALGRECPIDWKKDVDLTPEGKYSATYLYWSKPGKIAEITGIDKTQELSGVELIFQRFHEGEEILKTDNMYQVAFEIGIIASDKEDMINKISDVNQFLHLYDENRRDLLIPFDIYQKLNW